MKTSPAPLIPGSFPESEVRAPLARSKRVGGYIGIVLVTLLLLSALAVPGFRRARKRSQALLVLADAQLIDAAVDQFATEKDKQPGGPVRWEDLVPLLEAGSRLAKSGGCDRLGRPYAIGRILNESTQVKVHPETVRAFRDVIADPAAFWGDYLPAESGRPGASAVPRAGPR